MAFCHRSQILSLDCWDGTLDAQVVLSQLLASLIYNHHNVRGGGVNPTSQVQAQNYDSGNIYTNFLRYQHPLVYRSYFHSVINCVTGILQNTPVGLLALHAHIIKMQQKVLSKKFLTLPYNSCQY